MAPLELTAPAQVGPNVDRYEITGFSVNLPADLVRARYRYGLLSTALDEQGQPYEFVEWLGEATFKFPASDISGINPASTKSYYENLKGLLYQKGIDLGAFPAGGTVA